MEAKLYRDSWPEDSDFVNGVATRVEITPAVAAELIEKRMRRKSRVQECGEVDLGNLDSINLL
jgi:hypothetical protein